MVKCEVCGNELKEPENLMKKTPVLCLVCNTYNYVFMKRVTNIVRPTFDDMKEKDEK